MRKKRIKITQQDVIRWIKAWFKECAKQKRSFTSVADVPSLGRAHENPYILECDKRIIQHSDLEYKYGLCARFNPHVTEIETQVPLIDESNEILPQSPTMEIEYAFDFKEARFRGTTTNWI